MERGKDRAGRMLPWGCLAAAIVLTLACYGLYRWLIRIGFSGQIHL